MPATLRRSETFEASLTEALVALLRRPVPAALRRRAALHLIDWTGCAVAGAAEPAGAIFRADAADQPAGPATVVGGGRTTLRAAAFANGAFGNALEMDDVHRLAILHPGPVVIPAALALAQARAVSGTALLDAIVRGYEAMIRLGRALGPAHYRQFHPTATAGPFGAAAAAGDLLGLDDEQLVSALGNAGTQAFGLWQCRHEPVMTKQLHTARAAEAGLAAALLAARGLTGPRLILEGPQGLFAGMAADARPERVIDEPHAPWLLAETSIKPWPACRHAHPAIDAALMLRERTGPERIGAVEIVTFADALRFCDRPRPTTPLEAKFSLQHAVAIVLLDGAPTLGGFTHAAIARQDAAALRARIRVAAGEPFVSRYPAHFGAAVAVTLSDGRRFEAEVADALGDPENPLPDERLIAKAVMLMQAGGFDAARAEAVMAAALALAEDGPLEAFTAPLGEMDAAP